MPSELDRFQELLVKASAELHEDNPDRMRSGELLPTNNVINPGDVHLFWIGVEQRLIGLCRGGRFNTLDRPTSSGHWGLLSRATEGGWYNAEYLPQIAAYVDAVVNLGYPAERVLFELPGRSLQLDLAILDDSGGVVVLGEAKREVGMLDKLRSDILERFADAEPTEESKKRGDEARQLAWRVWTVRPDYTWLIGPGERKAYRTAINPLRLNPCGSLPAAAVLGLEHRPPRRLPPPELIGTGSSSAGRSGALSEHAPGDSRRTEQNEAWGGTCPDCFTARSVSGSCLCV